MMMQTLAEVAADPMISGKWLLDVIPVIAAAVVLILGRNHLKAQGAKEERATRTTIDGQPIGVELVETLATKQEMRELEGRLVMEIKKLESVISSERSVARTANGNLHARIDKTAEGLAAATATMTQLNAGLNRVLDFMIKPNTRTPR